jgi:hypothetical protein
MMEGDKGRKQSGGSNSGECPATGHKDPPFDAFRFGAELFFDCGRRARPQ